MKFFDDYVFTYDMKDPEINYKYHHSFRVMDIMITLAKKLNLSEKDIELSRVIGLLHDIGRFEQDKLFDSYDDRAMDHGDYGEIVLRENNFLEQTSIDKEDYEVVYKAVKNHNKFEIEKGLTERELLFAKLIRDADKLDILYAVGNPNYNILLQDEKEISKEIATQFFNNQSGNTKDAKSLNDKLVIKICFIYDINFKETFEIIYTNKYYDKLYERINRKDIFKPYIDHVNKYLEERMK
jgi:putative nucleotidyltransferase with HDIG domain